MSVKLLPKSKISELKQKERDIEVREGVKLATRVDGLRSLYSETEEKLEKYRNATVAQINEEIITLTTQKEALIGEIRHLETKYDAMLPAISLKREELAQFEKSLKSWEKKLEKREETASLAEIDVAEALDAAQSCQIMSEDNERITANLLRTAHEKKQEADQRVIEARNLQVKTEKDRKAVEESLNLRELGIQSKEQELSIKELQLMNQEKDLHNEKIKVADRQATLERALARLKAGRRA